VIAESTDISSRSSSSRAIRLARHADTDEAFIVLDGTLRHELSATGADDTNRCGPDVRSAQGVEQKRMPSVEVKMLLIEPLQCRNKGERAADPPHRAKRPSGSDAWATVIRDCAAPSWRGCARLEREVEERRTSLIDGWSTWTRPAEPAGEARWFGRFRAQRCADSSASTVVTTVREDGRTRESIEIDNSTAGLRDAGDDPRSARDSR